jgi:hypothetical protein
MDNKMKQAEKFAQARAEAMKRFDMTDAYDVGVAEFAVNTEAGWVKVKFTAVKAADFDAAQAQEDFRFEQEAKQVEKDAKAMEKMIKADQRAKEKAKNAKVEKADA